MSFFRNLNEVGPLIDQLVKELKDSKSDRSYIYNLSIIVLASGQIGDKKHYDDNLPLLLEVLDKAADNSFKAWMLGRVVLAAKQIGDQKTLEKNILLIKNLLKTVEKNADYAWALGYLAAVDELEYKEAHDPMISAVKSIPKVSDALWAHVMNLQAASKAKDLSTYHDILQQMKNLTNKSTITAALSDIPVTILRAWATGIVQLAAARINDKKLYTELNQSLTDELIEANKLNLTTNVTLAKICGTQAKNLMDLELDFENELTRAVISCSIL